MYEEKIWLLISRKLAGEASQEDQNELDRLIERDSELLAQFKIIEQIWENKPSEETIVDTQNLQRLLKKMAQFK